MLAVVTFKPGDDGHMLRCVYEHEANLPDGVYEDGINITVHCKLKIKCSRGHGSNPSNPSALIYNLPWVDLLFATSEHCKRISSQAVRRGITLNIFAP